MKIGNYDLKEIFEKFWSWKGRNLASIFWLLSPFVYVSFYIFFIFVMFVGGIGGEEDSTILGIFMVLFCCVYIAIVGFAIFMRLFAPGSAIVNLKSLLDKGSLTGVFESFGRKLLEGFKIMLVKIWYLLPLYLLLIVFFLFFSFFGGFMSMGEENGGYYLFTFILFFFLYIVMLFLITTFVLVYELIVRPIVYKFFVSGRWLDSFNPMKIWNEFKTNTNNYLYFLVVTLIFYSIWMAVYFFAAFLMYILIGFLVLPIVLGLLFLYQASIEPIILEVLVKSTLKKQ